MHTSSLPRLVAAFAIIGLVLVPSIAPQTAEAATRTSYSTRYRSYESSDFARYRSGSYSSSMQKKINALPKKAVQDLPIPIVLGVSQKNLTKNFGDPRDGGDRMHEGLDIMAPRGAFIASPTDAVVTKVGTGSSAGNYVYTVGPGGETFAFMHLDAFAEDLKAGMVLKPGNLIGFVGNTGNAAGGATHLHFEIRDGREPTDPYPRLTREFTSEEKIRALIDVITYLKEHQDD